MQVMGEGFSIIVDFSNLDVGFILYHWCYFGMSMDYYYSIKFVYELGRISFNQIIIRRLLSIRVD